MCRRLRDAERETATFKAKRQTGLAFQRATRLYLPSASVMDMLAAATRRMVDKIDVLERYAPIAFRQDHKAAIGGNFTIQA